LASYILDHSGDTLPVSPMAARLPSALAAILCLVVVYMLGRALLSHLTAIVAAGVMTTSLCAMFFSHNAQVEMLLTALCASAVACFWFGSQGNGWAMHLFYFMLALGALAKAPISLILVALPLAAWWFI